MPTVTDRAAGQRAAAGILTLTLAMPLTGCSRYQGDPDQDNTRRPTTTAARPATPDPGKVKALCDSIHATDVNTLFSKVDVIVASADDPGIPAVIGRAVDQYYNRVGLPEQGVERTNELNRRYGILIEACQQTGWKAP